MTKFDKILMIGILLISLLLLVIKYMINLSFNDVKVIVYKDNKVIKEVSLKDNIYYVIENTEDEFFKIEISSKSVRVANSSCKEKICVKNGWINSKGESLICAPKRIAVIIESDDSQVDALSF